MEMGIEVTLEVRMVAKNGAIEENMEVTLEAGMVVEGGAVREAA